MSDLVEQLRDIRRQPQGPTYKSLRELCGEAANEIVRLRDQITQLECKLDDMHAEYHDARRAGWPVR